MADCSIPVYEPYDTKTTVDHIFIMVIKLVTPTTTNF